MDSSVVDCWGGKMIVLGVVLGIGRLIGMMAAKTAASLPVNRFSWIVA